MAKSYGVRNLSVSLQIGTQKTLYATWAAPKLTAAQKKFLNGYKVVWYWAASGSPWYEASSSSESSTTSTYTMPDNAIKAKITVTPVSKKTKKWKGRAVSKEYSIDKTTPNTPPTPSITIDGITATITLANYDSGLNNANVTIDIDIVEDGLRVIQCYGLGYINGSLILTQYLSYGHRYTVRARAYNTNAGIYSLDWSNYSNESKSYPSAPAALYNPEVQSDSSVKISWAGVSGADKYTIEYATDPSYFDASAGNVSSVTVENGTTAILTGLGKGYTYYFRVKAVTDNVGESAWTGLVSVILGTVPAAPTTWSSTSTAKVGESIKLYWVHNSQDNSSQSQAQIQFTITNNGKTTVNTVTWTNNRSEDDKDKTVEYPLDTSPYTSGAIIKWKVRTRGILPDYGDWSVEREIDIYAQPTIVITSDIPNEVLTTFPIKIAGEAGPASQNAISYYIEVISKSSYDSYDAVGNIIPVYPGDVVYSKQINANGNSVTIELNPEDVDLEDDMSYQIRCTVAMDSGLTAESNTIEFTVKWDEASVEVFGDPEWLDEDAVALMIYAYCENEDGECDPNYTMSVYRKSFDGKYVEIQSGMTNTRSSLCVDPHPPLNQVSYRIVAKSKRTGAMHFYDTDPFELNKTGIIIQWDDQNVNRTIQIDEETETVAESDKFNGSMVKLPCNVEISPNHDLDVSLIEYIGKSHPTSYYGTQLGETASWNAEIPKDDTDTLAMIRRLAVYLGDVYVRETSGMGYWAQVKVSYSRKYNTMIIPITFNVTRVEGGK